MTKEQRQRQREATWATPKLAGEPAKSPYDEKLEVLAQLAESPGWQALKSTLQAIAPFRVPATEETNFDIALHRNMFRAQLAVEIIKIVESASSRIKTKPEATA